jgi:diguanylate cyclase (GGDEF)-like protein
VKRGGVWIAPALCLLGLGAVLFAVWRGTAWALVAAAGGFLAAFTLRFRGPAASPGRPLDLGHTLDLLRRAHAATAAWGVGLPEGSVEVTADVDVPRDVRRRGSAIVQLASVDGRVHVARDPEGIYVAVGDFPYGAGVLLAAREPEPQVAAAVDELRRLVAGMRLAEPDLPEAQSHLVARQLALVASGAQTLEGIARAAAELAQQLSQRGAVVVLREGGGDGGEVIAVSTAADRRLAGLRLKPEAPAVRAVQTGLPVVSRGAEDVFGPGVPERRRRERAGSAYPLVDGRLAIGALVLVGAPLQGDSPVVEQISRLVAELGPRLAAAKAVHDAEQRAVVDPLTGLRNRREFERVLDRYRHDTHRQPPPPATLIYVDLDRFKQLNDSLGHAAGDAALRHVARILERAVRDGDLVARIGGEEFAVWLPRTPLVEGLEVAERVRSSVAETAWHWSGAPHPVTASCGVAAYPEPIGDLTNLRASADAALYRAKQAGRNRVEKAAPGR